MLNIAKCVPTVRNSEIAFQQILAGFVFFMLALCAAIPYTTLAILIIGVMLMFEAVLEIMKQMSKNKLLLRLFLFDLAVLTCVTITGAIMLNGIFILFPFITPDRCIAFSFVFAFLSALLFSLSAARGIRPGWYSERRVDRFVQALCLAVTVSVPTTALIAELFDFGLAAVRTVFPFGSNGLLKSSIYSLISGVTLLLFAVHFFMALAEIQDRVVKSIQPDPAVWRIMDTAQPCSADKNYYTVTVPRNYASVNTYLLIVNGILAPLSQKDNADRHLSYQYYNINKKYYLLLKRPKSIHIRAVSSPLHMNPPPDLPGMH